MASKKHVAYSELLGDIIIGQRTWVVTVNHPDTRRVTNGSPVRTSQVVAILGDGDFETLYSTYHYEAKP